MDPPAIMLRINNYLHQQSAYLQPCIGFVYFSFMEPLVWIEHAEVRRQLDECPYLANTPPYPIPGRPDHLLWKVHECIRHLRVSGKNLELPLLTSQAQLKMHVQFSLWIDMTRNYFPSLKWLEAYPQTKVGELLHFGGEGRDQEVPYTLARWVVRPQQQCAEAYLLAYDGTLITALVDLDSQSLGRKLRPEDQYMVPCSYRAFSFHDGNTSLNTMTYPVIHSGCLCAAAARAQGC